ncbi:MAG: LysR family transcriptional regulator [Oscillospiraceae bacterium]|nr:LysR family transcriptional regulator [Oscillospiraceae bacterium]
MNFNQLEYFIALYQTRSVTKAAKSLFMTRQALSLGLSALEEELGVPLFIRMSTGLEPTKEGEILFRYACDALKTREEVVSQVQAARQNTALSLALHTILYSRTQLRSIKEACQQITGCNPKILHISSNQEGLDLILQGKADLAVVYKPLSTKGVQCISVIDPSEHLLLMSTSDPLSRTKGVDFLSDLKDREVIFLSSELMNSLSDSLHLQNAAPILLSADRELLWESIETDKALMVIPAQCRSVFLNKDTTVRRLQNYPIKTGVFLLARADSRSAAVNQLIEFLPENFRKNGRPKISWKTGSFTPDCHSLPP